MAIVPFTFASQSGIVPASELDDNFAACQTDLGFTPVNVAGDTMLGTLLLSGNPVASLAAVPLQYLTGHTGAPAVLAIDQQVSGASGQNFVATTWTDCRVTTLQRNTISASIGSNRITLPAGTYYMRVKLPVRPSAGLSIRLKIYNVTAAADLVTGSQMAATTINNDFNLTVQGQFTLSAQSDVSAQYYLSSGTGGTGAPVTLVGYPEVYTVIEIYGV